MDARKTDGRTFVDRDGDGKRISVAAVEEGNKKYFAAHCPGYGRRGLKLVRFNPAGALPLRKSREQAEADLVQYAEDHGLPEIF